MLKYKKNSALSFRDMEKSNKELLQELQELRRENELLKSALLKNEVHNLTYRISAGEYEFKNIFEIHDSVMLLIVPETGSIVNANYAASKFYGYSQAQLCSMKIEEINTMDREQIAKETAKAVKEERNYFLVPHKLANGDERNVEVHSSPIDVNGQKLLFAIIHDVTNHKKSEEKLKISEKFNKHIVENANEGIWVIDINQITQYVNLKMSEILGFSVDEIIGKKLFDFIYEDDLQQHENQMNDRIAGKSSQYERRFKKKDGTVIWALVSASAIIDDNKVTGAFAMITDISELRQVKIKFKENDDFLTAIIDCNPDCIKIVDSKGRLLMMNSVGLELIQAESMDQVVMLPILDLIAPEYKSDFEELHQNVISGKSMHLEFELVGLRSRRRWLATNAVPIEIRGKIVHLGVTRDITSRKNAELALQKSEESFRNIFNMAPLGIYRTSMEGEVLLANPALIEMLGYSSFEELRNMVFEKEHYLNTDLRQKFIDNIETKGKVDNFEVVWKKKDGSIIYVNEYARAIYDQSGIILYFEGIVEDVTSRKLAEEAFKNSSELNKSMLQTIPFGMHIIDDKGVVLFQNEILKELCGNNVVGSICWEVYRDDKTICSDCPLMSDIEVGVTNVYEANRVFDGRVFEIIYSRMNFQSQKAILEIFIDITQRKQAEELLYKQNQEIEAQYKEFMQLNEVLLKANFDLEVAKKHAEESDKLKTAFLQNISHEIRTPLNGIIGFSNLLQEENISKEEIKDFTKIIQKSGNRLIEIVNNVLDISKIETQQIEIHHTRFSLNSLITDLHSFFESIAYEKTLALNFHNALDDENSIIVSDFSKLNQILTNLINNAIKFTSQGSIEFGYKISNNEILFYVNDTGIGIAAEWHEKIFERFIQTDLSISRGYEGAGIGLAICKGLVELLGGKIWLESEKNNGTTFFFALPCNFTSSPNTIEIDEPIFFNQKQKIKVLVAEDDLISFLYLKNIFNSDNFILLHAKNGKEAVEMVRITTDIDIVLMDIKMPVMDGMQATKQIKQFRPNLPIIAQTAFAFNEEKDVIMGFGFDDYITKPIKKRILLELFEKYSSVENKW